MIESENSFFTKSGTSPTASTAPSTPPFLPLKSASRSVVDESNHPLIKLGGKTVRIRRADVDALIARSLIASEKG